MPAEGPRGPVDCTPGARYPDATVRMNVDAACHPKAGALLDRDWSFDQSLPSEDPDFPVCSCAPRHRQAMLSHVAARDRRTRLLSSVP